jgi:flavin reductase (DIM6/NTAB) family NADH-FMN oxidoreductase RutF
MDDMLTIEPGTIPTKDLHQFLLGTVAPRPIAFASTIDEQGRPNIAPYSFFNAFSSNPPIVVFSSNRRVADNTTKDTLYNVRATGEVVINAVNYDIVRKMAVASVEYPQGVSEFEKIGLTPIPSDLVKPFRVKESPAHMECVVQEVVPLGEHGGAGHLIICKVLRMHISKSVIEGNNRINPHKMDLMGRMGRAYYVRASGEAIHTIVQSVTDIPVGFDGLPDELKLSPVLTGNQIGLLAGLKVLPKPEDAQSLAEEDDAVRMALEGPNPVEALLVLGDTAMQMGKNEHAGRLFLLAHLAL